MTTTPGEQPPAQKPSTLIRILHGISVVAAIFSLVVISLLAFNIIQTRDQDLLNLPTLEQFRTNYRAASTDQATLAQLRDLDLLARRAFFSSQTFIKSGSILALIGLLIFLAASRTAAWLQWKMPVPQKTGQSTHSGDSFFLARGGVTALGILLILGIAGLWMTQPSPSPILPAAPQPFTPSTGAQGVISPAKGAEPTNQSVTATSNPSPVTPAPVAWPFFRGPGGNGHATTTMAPLAWNGPANSNILWKTAIPQPGFSSPIVVSNRVFLSGGSKELREVYCLDADSGRILWQKPVKGIEGSPADPPKVTDDTGYAAPTMAATDRQVFVIFATGDCAGFDLLGNLIWGRNLGVPDNHYAHSSSLLTFNDTLIVQFDDNKSPKVMALRTDTGATVWSTPRQHISWASPICVDVNGRKELILTCNKSVDSYAPNTGSKLWSLDCLDGEVGPSAAFANGLVFVANDTACAAALRPPIPGGTAPALVWKIDEQLPDVASPLATDKHLFLATSGGTITCRDAETGKLLWEHEFTDGFHASPVLVNDRVYALDREGVMHIFKAANTFESLGDSPIGEPASATPAFVNDRIYLRGDKSLFCIRAAKP